MSILMIIGLQGAIVLIDTQWNVNFDYDDVVCAFEEVLIDTQWNVNYNRKKLAYRYRIVLIDTQWNVNYEQST